MSDPVAPAEPVAEGSPQPKPRPWALYALLACLVIAAVAVPVIQSATRPASSDSTTVASADRALPSTVVVRYEVEGTAKWADVTMETPSGTKQDSPDVPMVRASDLGPIEYPFAPGSFVYLSAQNKDSSGTITCRIRVDGAVISENSSSGAFAIATCKGTAR